MKTPLIAAGLFLMLAAAAAAQDSTQKPLEATRKPGYDRPSPRDGVTGGPQHVVYWNDSLDHYDLDMQEAAGAFSAADLHLKSEKHHKS